MYRIFIYIYTTFDIYRYVSICSIDLFRFDISIMIRYINDGSIDRYRFDISKRLISKNLNKKWQWNIFAKVFISRTQRVIEYLGIPYARPPVGPLRFAPPSTNPLPTWSGARNATQFGPSCQQVSGRLKLHEKLYLRLLPPDQPDPGTSEDCLLLNIFIPDGKDQLSKSKLFSFLKIWYFYLFCLFICFFFL